MKTFILFVMTALAPVGVFAMPVVPVDESARAELIKEIEADQAVRPHPRLVEFKTEALSAQAPLELIKVQNDFRNWKNIRFAARRVETAASAARETIRIPAVTDASWARLFDNRPPSRSDAAPERFIPAPAPLAADDPARYDNIRALLLSQGVERTIIDAAISEGIRQNVDPMIVLSVIHQESKFRKDAYNRNSGATGLMQLSPATADDMGASGSLYDAATNIKAGVKYLNWIANSFFKMNLNMSDLAKVPAEKLKIVLASYNWGVGNVRKSLHRYGAQALDLIAPEETRNFIEAIPRRISSWFASI